MKAATLERVAFKTSRALEYFSEKELVLQTGHDRSRWAEVVLKELVDNALDAAEEHDRPVEIAVTLAPDRITVADNGPGLPADVLAGVLDYSVRVSSKDAYITPTRGAQGNALKTVLAIPFVLSGSVKGEHRVQVGDTEHRLRVEVDRLRQVPAITHESGPAAVVRAGTAWTVCWPELARLDLAVEGRRFLQLLESYALLNPHAGFVLEVDGQVTTFERSAPRCGHWRPNEPMSPHWYAPERFRDLVAAFVAAEADGGEGRTARELVAMFRGLSATAKQKAILGALGLAGVRLREFVRDGDVDRERAAALLAAMREASKPVKPTALGCLGEAHIQAWLARYGGVAATVKYRRVAEVDDTSGLPFVVELAFAARETDGKGRRLMTGINWTPTLVDPFREFAGFGIGLDGLLHDCYVRSSDPVTVVVHLACPRLHFTDRGKSSLEAL